MDLKKTLATVGISAYIAAQSLFGQGISGTAHDFSTKTWNSSGEICITCHTPHNSIPNASPLWNHSLSTATYTLYGSNTLDGLVGQPDAESKLCLSCHDGLIALDSFGGATGSNYITGSKNLGNDLSNDHPISFTYDTNLANTDGGLYNPLTALSGLGGTIDQDMLYNGKLQCSSCHDVHDSMGIGFLLVKSNGASALCLTCHAK